MDQEDRLTKALADRYRIEREIGSGGMATVYLAEDLKHNRKVAVKVLNPELAQNLGAERFLREIRTAANLTHPHILPIHDSGEADGFLYYVMPYAKGESLRSRLTKEKQLPVEDAIQITREIADALAYAHREGVIHRDVKPANIMLEEGHAVLADFGVAHAVAAAKDERLTRTGTSLGTPAYMSPEQATGEQDLDGRSDQYALGCVLFEMLAGHPPFTGAQVEAVIRQHLMEEPPLVTRVRPSVTAEVVKVINRALSKSPADRFKTTGEMAAALALTTMPGRNDTERFSRPVAFAWAVSGLVVIGAVATLIFWPREGRSPGSPVVGLDDKPTIAVLPFDNFSPDPDDDYFASGVQEDLTKKLGGISKLAVTSRTSLEQYRDPANRPPIRQIAAELGADYLLEGSARIVGDSVRITVQLIEGASDVHLWSDDFDAAYSVENFVRLQAEIAQQIAFHLRTAISPGELEWLEAIPTQSLDALEAYMKGNAAFFAERQLNQTASGFPSITWYEEAVRLDLNFALAHARLALSLAYTPQDQGRDERIRRAAERALALAGELPEARLALETYFLHQGDPEEAARQIELAAQVAPDHSLVVRHLAQHQGQSGEYAAAIQTLLRAERLDPLDPFLPRSLAFMYTYLHRYDDALDAFAREAARSETPPLGGVRNQARIHLLRGDREKARAAISELSKSRTSSSYNLIPTTLNMVVLRYMTAEDRQDLFDMYTDWAREQEDYPLPCTTVEDYCLRKAIHEQDVGSAEQAQVLWDSLRVALETAPPPTEYYYYGIRALIHMEVGEENAALEVARTEVRLYAPEGCRTISTTPTSACTMLARVLARFGEHDEAIDLVEEMLPAPSWYTVHLLEIDPIWDPLRDHPRFQALLERYSSDVEH